jgi:hypothetical protein
MEENIQPDLKLITIKKAGTMDKVPKILGDYSPSSKCFFQIVRDDAGAIFVKVYRKWH